MKTRQDNTPINYDDFIAENAKRNDGELARTIGKTYDYIDGGFTKPDSLLLCDAQPLMDIPDYVQDYFEQAKIPNNFYTKPKGDDTLLDVLRLNAMAQDIPFHKTENIAVTAGGFNGFSAVCHALCDDGDVILALSPTYILFASCTQPYGAELVLVPSEFRGEKFQVTPKTLDNTIINERKKGRRVKGVLVINPTNVDGQYWTKEDIDAIAPTIRKHNLMVIEDRVYDQMVFDTQDDGQKPAYFANNALISDLCITIDSTSKRYGATQWRLGWMYGPKKIMAHVRNYILNCIWSTTTLFQRTTAFMLASGLPELPKGFQPLSVDFEDFYLDAQTFKPQYNAYFDTLLAGYKERRDLSSYIFNGQSAYQKMLNDGLAQTPIDTLENIYGDYFEKYNMSRDGVLGFSTPVIPRQAMFYAINAEDSIFETLPAHTKDPSQMLHRLIYLNTRVVLLPPDEITLPKGYNLYRMEYGLESDIFFEALSKLQSFMREWFSYPQSERNSMVEDAWMSLPDKYRLSEAEFKVTQFA